MKILKRILLTAIAVSVLCIAFRGWIYRHTVAYRSVGQRPLYAATEPALLKFIRSDAEETSPGIEAVVRASLSKTSGHLRFSASRRDSDPNKLIHAKTAHCVGYAAFFATTCNDLLEQSGLSDTWTAIPQIGQLYLFGKNVHGYFNTPFFKDHDFVVVRNKSTGETIAVDPSVHDYLYIERVTFCGEQGK
ncbi:MAG: hypothetical protein H6565_12865 [Lewinellaceae bacterium]|nr:hypothetical protein [Lewinellaceae bacterium]